MYYPFMVPLVLALLLQQPTEAPRFERLDNGLRICIVEDHSLPLVSVQLWFKVGSSYAPPDKPGLTHVAAALLSKRGRMISVEAGERTLPDVCRVFFAPCI